MKVILEQTSAYEKMKAPEIHKMSLDKLEISEEVKSRLKSLKEVNAIVLKAQAESEQLGRNKDLTNHLENLKDQC